MTVALPAAVPLALILASSVALRHADAIDDGPDADNADALSPWGTPERDPWTISIEPSASYFGFAGDITMPGVTSNGTEISLEDLRADDPSLNGFAEIHLRRERWRITVSGFMLHADDEATADRGFTIGNVPVFAGEITDTEIDFAEFEASVSYRWKQYVSGKTADGRDAVSAGLDVIGGLRFIDVDLDVSVDPTDAGRTGMEATSVGVDELFAQPFAGLRLDLAFHERFAIDVNTEFGYFEFDDTESFTWNITVGLAWEPVEHVGLQIGYRMLFFNLTADESPSEFEWSGSTAGLYFGARFEF